jgi:hypothetical protein
MRHDAGEPLGLRGSKECKVGRFAYRRLRSVFGFARFDRDHLELVARGPKPEQQAALRASRFLRRFERGGNFNRRLGISSGYELEEKREQFHNMLRLPGGIP